MNRSVWLAALVTLVSVASFGQQAAQAGRSGGWWSVSVGGGFAGPSITGAPYSAEEITENIQTLVDGTHITHKSTTKMYRDSAGRTRTERSMSMPGADNADPPMMIEISDPVAHVRYMLYSQSKTAQKITMTDPGSLPASRPVPATQARRSREAHDPQGPGVKTEKLGSQTMEGLLVEGTRRATTWPAGSMMGNDRPITTVSETWRSPELQVVVLSKTSDPRSGEITQKLTNINRAEPDPSLFQPPADYTVQENEQPSHLQ